ncbi:MFS transporter [Rhodococcus jostii]|uniref:MFS transporter, DHA2 family, methylenomycin A resistance protein n=1 Tax=Rhodococcus jostii TaxID=132919 RepID=A0A1H5MKU3_RHOJO|nr:MFS transporter [Rhodococcus jostii]SEE89750.1 MFS transporter, DHA2 family, methylenomycin A resistance protein [Rhodococcus jostii]
MTSYPAPGIRPPLLLGICAMTFVVYLDTSITPVALPDIVRDLGGGGTAAQWILDGYTLAFACLLLAGGLLGDRIGARRVLLAGTVLFTFASLLCAIAPGMGALVAARALQGVAAAAIVPLSVAALSTHIPDPAARARAIGLWGGTAGVALAVGPLLGGVLVTTAGWRALFWINLPVCLLAWLCLRSALQTGRPQTGRGLDVPGQILFVVAGCSLTLLLIEGPHRGWTSLFVLGCAVTAAVVVAVFVVWETRTRHPLLSPDLFRIPEVTVACAVNFLGLFGLYGVLFVLTLFFQRDLGLSPLQTGLRFLPLFGMLGVASLIAAIVARRFGTRRTMVTGLGLICAGLVGLVSVTLDVPPIGYLIALGLLGGGIPLSGGVVAIQAMADAVPTAAMGAASGAMNTFRQFGAVFGVAIAALASPPAGDAAVTNLPATFLLAAAGAALGGVLTAVALRPKRVPAQAETEPEPIHSETR